MKAGTPNAVMHKETNENKAMRSNTILHEQPNERKDFEIDYLIINRVVWRERLVNVRERTLPNVESDDRKKSLIECKILQDPSRKRTFKL